MDKFVKDTNDKKFSNIYEKVKNGKS